MAVVLPSAGLVRYYLSSGQNEVAEYDWAGQRLRYYVHGPTYIDERVVMHNDPVAGGAATTGSDYIYLLKDLCTVAGMADERGWPVERYDYDAYGKVYMERLRALPWAADFDGDGDVDDDDLAVVHAAYKGSGQEPNGVRGWWADLDGDGDVDGSDYALFADAYRGAGVAPGGGLSLRSASMAVSRIGNPYFFTGRRLDVIDIQDAGTPHHFTDDYPGLQLYDYRARTYDPVVGKFNQRDPVTCPIQIRWASHDGGPGFRYPRRRYDLREQGPLAYEYVRSMPLLLTDPSGLWGESISDSIWGALGQIQACKQAVMLLLLALTQNATGGDPLFPGKSDKYLHCCFSCRLSAGCGSYLSLFLGTLREAFQQLYSDWEDVMGDMMANVDGIDCGKNIKCPSNADKACAACCDGK